MYFDTLTMLRQLLAGTPPDMLPQLIGGLLGQPQARQAEAA